MGFSVKSAPIGAGSLSLVFPLLWMTWVDAFAQTPPPQGPTVPVEAQLPPIERPRAQSPTLPSVERENASPSILPKVPLPDAQDTRSLEAGRRVYIRDYRLTGNTMVSTDTLAKLTSPYANRKVSFSELAALRDELTRAYIERGYVTSGAVIPPQTLEDGVLEIKLIEGELLEVVTSTSGRLRESYIRNRIYRGDVNPVNVKLLEERLQILQQDERISRIEANLVPGEELGQSVLNLAVSESKPHSLYLETNNYQSPNVGQAQGTARFTHNNVTGFGDRFSAGFRGSQGLSVLDSSYAIPLGAYDTMLSVHGQYARSQIVEGVFPGRLGDSEIRNRSATVGLTVSQPVYRTVNSRFDLALTAEYRRSEAFFDDRNVDVNRISESRVAALRLSQDWTTRRRDQALALRSTISVGVDALGATTRSGDSPDGRFVSWLGQAQYARRLDFLDAQLISRGAVQLSDSALLGLEKTSLGGHASVRGYRENLLLTDNSASLSLEARVPVLPRSVGLPRLEIGPFIDIGHSWDYRASSNERIWLGAAGVGARWYVADNVTFEGTWATAFIDEPAGGDGGYSLQDDGIQFRISAEF